MELKDERRGTDCSKMSELNKNQAGSNHDLGTHYNLPGLVEVDDSLLDYNFPRDAREAVNLQLTCWYLFSSMQVKLIKINLTYFKLLQVTSSYFKLLGSNLLRQVRSMRSDKVTCAIRWHQIPPSSSSYSHKSVN
jgi:hypothetical protein